jgi:photosystem II stability/assembly factor-like uncharacterized protein
MSSNAMTLMRAARTRPPRSGAVSAIITAAVVVAAAVGCGTRPASGEPGQVAHRRSARAVLTATFRLPGIVFGVASGDGAAWLATGNGVLRIGRLTDQISRVLSAPGASLTSIAFGAGSVWVKDGGQILRIDPATGQILARIKVLASVMTGGGLSFGDGALWTATFAHDRPGLARIDPATNGVRVTPLPCAKVVTLAAGEGGVWISQLCGPGFPLLRIDPATGRITARLTAYHSFWHLAVGDGALWASQGASVARIDPKAAQLTATISLAAQPAGPGNQPAAQGPGLLAAGAGVLWVTGAGAHHADVLRIDPRTSHLAGTGLKIGGEPLSAAASGTTVWVLTSDGLTRIDLVACGPGRRAQPAPRASPATVPAPVWLYSLQMVSARDGWALAWTKNPAGPAPTALMPVHTVDGGHTWAPVTPDQAKPLLVPDHSYEVLLAVSPGRAWLAVTLAHSEASYGTRPALTEVFGTANAGRSWTGSAPIHAPGDARWLAFTDPAHGWLLQDLGAAMGNNPVRLYRTGDGGRTWSLIAASPRWNQASHAGASPSGLPVACDKTGIGFATPADGWLTSACFSLASALLVTRDAGAHWAPQALPLPAGACAPGTCFISAPQFFGSTGFLTIDHGGTPYLLTSQDSGTTWHPVAVLHAAGPFGTAWFFSARQGLLIPAASQDTPGEVFYLTSDGGHTWTPIRQGIRFQPGMTVNFTSPQTGFAWNPNSTGAPPIYATTNGGRTWTWYLPQLAPSQR